ncbi:hypothetical protein [Salipiger bermudensis]|uniref:hypothetical protein n=1 Tax=Salipiger bermudensis TaxID=344736 RepID=UPI001CD453FC|nr:hypothetical protein [Salipiger bermudensis]MCA0963233.1 hypothetical protein [Salipiger bermudensis]
MTSEYTRELHALITDSSRLAAQTHAQATFNAHILLVKALMSKGILSKEDVAEMAAILTDAAVETPAELEDRKEAYQSAAIALLELE